ncbi:hypothetical protein Pla108_30220 [Botrimarina colliarenosi]|uniref:Uncharacterized protein n=1 Tax=Botrimarina colliarenosi TaxID=2528001 RepID=A0A5C6A9S1_9BACT|nr:hypothetical protein [Botrimarina colliarenosi]TWT95945.1 hypothetical protein Pla108_30220 [Botrimarina colliarenosi]
MTRRRFAFWIGMGLFGVAERLRADSLDALAESLMKATDTPAAPPEPLAATVVTSEMPVHWQATHNRTWRWVQREQLVDGEWRLTGMTTPVRRDNGEPLADVDGYLDDEAIPESYRTAFDDLVDANGGSVDLVTDHGVSADDDAPGPDASPHRKARHGRPPSRWLRSLNAAELSVWLASVTPPEAGVHGMTFEEHLTRDHLFDADRLAGLTERELEKLHGAAHHGY